MKIILTVDPGFTGTGYALWQSIQGGLNLLEHGSLYTKMKTIEERSIDLACQLNEKCSNFEVLKLIIEYPAVFRGASGYMVAMRGDIVKLSFLVGMICGYINCEKFELLPVAKWKGQLPKSVCIRRIEKILPLKGEGKVSTHAYDAIGMGLFLIGRF